MHRHRRCPENEITFLKATRRRLPIQRLRKEGNIYSTSHDFGPRLNPKVMEHDILNFKAAGADGVVIGCLNEDGTIDEPSCRSLIDAARYKLLLELE